MQYLDLTLPTPAENLALDEALLEEAEQSGGPWETLRFWEPAEKLVVVGRSSRVADEVRREECDRLGVPILRRVSGGAAIVAGPGCLMYALVLSHQLRPELRVVDVAHRTVLRTLVGGLASLVPGIACKGTSDLVVRGEEPLKVSGNSVRMKREHLLYHGTLLYDFPLEWIERLLTMPPRRPDYRRDRPHAAFVANLRLDAAALRRTLRDAWRAAEPRPDWPRDRVAQLVAQRYARPEWNAGSM
jgi:lipoate-protein ligase A